MSLFARFRHEIPVTNAPLKIIHSDDDVLVLDKPSSIPVSIWHLIPPRFTSAFFCSCKCQTVEILKSVR